MFGKVFLLSGSGDGGMMTGTGMELDLPGGTWSLDNFRRGGTVTKTNKKHVFKFLIHQKIDCGSELITAHTCTLKHVKMWEDVCKKKNACDQPCHPLSRGKFTTVC